MQTTIKLSLNLKLIIFLVILEILTIPIVAISNTIVVNKPIYLLGMGFGAGAFALVIIILGIKNYLQKYFSRLLNINITNISGILYIALISGFLLMFMFYIQDLTYNYTQNDYIIGGVSAFFSVAITLILYKVIFYFFNYGIKIKTSDDQKYLISFLTKDIIIITLLFTLYETIASPLSILWLPHTSYRFFWGIISGIASGVIGGLPLVIISYYTNYKVTLKLKQA